MSETIRPDWTKKNVRTLNVQCFDCRESLDFDVSKKLPTEDELDRMMRAEGWINGRCEDCAASNRGEP